MRFALRSTLLLLALLAGAGNAAAQQATTIILVRHAEKVTTNPLNQNPPLTPAGEARARALADALSAAGVNTIITTQLRRTQQTAQPLAQALHITPEVVQMRGSSGNANAVAAAIRRHPGRTILVVGHSTTIPQIIAALGGPRMGQICESAYSNVFVVVLPARGAPSVVHAHYGAPDPDGGHECHDGIHEGDR